MEYYRPISTDDGLTLSIDGLVIDYHIGNAAERDELVRLLSTLDLRYAVNIRHWQSLRIGTFRENFSLSFLDSSSFWLGLGLNEVKQNFGRIRLDVNPNHCVRHQVFQILFGWLNTVCGSFRTTIRRFDLAIDIEACRADVELLKDHRAYTEIRKSQTDRTQYLGARSAGGRIKLYNKTIESKLKGPPLTRLELTLDPSVPYSNITWPKAYAIKTRQAQLDELTHLTDTERALLDGILAGNIDLTRLGRKTRLKLEQYMNGYVQWITVSPSDYRQILNRLRTLTDYPNADLGVDTVLDKLPRPQPSLPSWVENAERSPINPLAL